MSLTLADIDFLRSETGARLLERLVHDDLSAANTLPLLTALRREVTPQQAGAALEMARLRGKAVEKFGDDAARMLFSREALEQASDPLVRRYRARAWGGARCRVIDACCSIGADALAFAQAGAAVVGLDIDPVRIAMARHNAGALDLDQQVAFDVADAREGVPDGDLAFYDPARRDETGRRIHNVEAYQPPLSLVKGWPHPAIVVKLSPGIDLDQVRPYGGVVEFISVGGDLKEALLRLGEGEQGLEATLLTNAGEYHWRGTGEAVIAPISQPRGWLVEPDPALLRAGLVGDFAVALGGAQLDETIAYVTTDEEPLDESLSPWARAWKIIDWMPFSVKALRAYLRERNVGRVTVKKRGTAVTPDALIPQLKLKGDESRTLVLTRHQGQQIVMVCDDLHPPIRTD